ncbi:MAG TPA: exodeoxyribonuclease VII small subunit, partial [Candidatus Omnitrophota bacterium]|nr:exodeoxyribonuclease VII small subunit [Candidatus Omnitrophota bacterium]
MAEIKFEEALKRLEKIVEELEQGDLSLDEALKKYQDG